MQQSGSDSAPLVVKAIEHLEGDYGSYTWPCAPVLAQYVYSKREFISGKKVLELGAGTAVPGIVAAKCGGHVTLSDCEDNPQLLENLRHTCTINGVTRTKVVVISWGIFSPTVLQLEGQDVILASDCFYDSKNFEDILATVAYFFEKNHKCKFWTTYQERRLSPNVVQEWKEILYHYSSNRSLLHLLNRWGLQCRSIPLETFQDADVASEGVRIEGLSKTKMRSNHTIHLWEITKKDSGQGGGISKSDVTELPRKEGGSNS